MELSNAVKTIKKLASYIVPIKIHGSYRTTVDETLTVPAELATTPINFVSRVSKKYKLSSKAGLFELDSQVMGVDKRVYYVVRHSVTGRIFRLPKDTFEILFE